MRAIMMLSFSIILIALLSPLPTGGQTVARQLKLSSGEATIIGSMSGAIISTARQMKSLHVMINFGELSPINRNRIIKAVVPITISGNPPFHISASAAIEGDANIIKLSDIGFGLQNLRSLSTNAATRQARPRISSKFEFDPAFTQLSATRINYRCSLADIRSAAVVMDNPHIINDHSARNGEANWLVDAIFTIAPQFYPPGQFIVTINFTIDSDTNSF